MARSGGTAKTVRPASGKRGAGDEVRLAGQRRRDRRGLLATTALQAGAVMLLSFPLGLQAFAQPAPTARPQGGSVVAGQATIGQTVAQTTVAQSSQRAAIDWRSYDIGSGHSVVYQQPNSSSITVNRVTGPDPSQIAGSIHANGQIVIVNGSGVVFMNGSQVDAQSLIVTSANISNKNVMAGRLVFDQPGKPGATISNAGSITVRQTGLAALVAPNVANSGTITARMGHVVLAGAEAHTVDLYGDGLMSVDVTRQVRRGADGSTALVTNTGTIAADGGTIVLTAQAADGIVTNLVTNTGRLRANSVGGKTGTIVVSAVGGSISVEGPVQAQGRAPGTTGGTVVLAATDTVAVGARARISASGQAGGGTVAIGTTVARARVQGGGVPVGSARVATVAAGARISADAKVSGNGGSVAILSTDNTVLAGAISARGGRQGGNGGNVEVSGEAGFALTGTVDVGAAKGLLGNILLDPTNLTIVHGAAGSQGDDGTVSSGTVGFLDGYPASYIVSDGAINKLTGSVTLQAVNVISLSPNAAINLTTAPGTQSFALQAGGNILVPAGTSIAASGPIVLLATYGIVLGGNVSGPSVQLNGATIMQATGTITTPTLTASANTISLGGTNAVGSLGTVMATGVLEFNNSQALGVAGPVMAGMDGMSGGTASIAASGALTLTGNVSGQSVTLAGSSITQSSGSIQALTPGTGTITLSSAGSIMQTGGTLTAGVLTGAATVGSVSLQQGNMVGTLGPFTASSGFSLKSSSALTVAGPVMAGNSGDATITSTAALTINGNVTGQNVTLMGTSITQSGGAVTASDMATGTITLTSTGDVVKTAGTLSAAVLTGTAANVSLSESGGNTNSVVALGPFAATGQFSFADSVGLKVSGQVTAGTGNVAITSTAGLTVAANVMGQNVALAGTSISQTGGTISAAKANSGSITLNSGGAVTQSGNGVLSAPVLMGSAGSAGLNGANAVGTLSAFSTTGLLAFTDAQALSLSGTVAGSSVTLVAPSVTQTGGTVSATMPGTGTIMVTTPGALSQSGGTFGGPILAGTAASVSLTGANTLISLGAFTTTGAFRFNNATALAVGGAIVAGMAGPGDASISSVAGLTIMGNITAPNVTLTGASIGQTAGTVMATGGSGAITLTSTGDVIQTGGVFSAPVLTGSVGTLLAQGNNVVPVVTGLSGTGRVALNDTVALSINGTVKAGTGGTGDLVFVSSAGVTAAGTLTSPGVVALTGSTVTETGSITAGTRFDVSVGAVAANFTLGGMIMAPDIRLGQAEAVAVGTDGPRSASLVVTGPFTVGGNTLDLESSGAITQTGGTLTAGTLTGNGGSLVLTDANIGTLAAFSTSGGTLALADSLALTITGQVAAKGGDAVISTPGLLTITGGVSGPNVMLSAANIVQTGGAVVAMTAGTGTVTLSTPGTIMQSAGSVGGPVLTITGGVSSVSLLGPNTAASLSAISVPGAFTLVNMTALTLAGPVTAGTSGSGDAMISAAGGLAVAAPVMAPNVTLGGGNITQTATVMATGTMVPMQPAGLGTVTLMATGLVSQTGAGGVITASTLTGTVGSAMLIGSNMVGTLGSLSATGTLAFNNAQALILAGAISGGSVTLSGPSVTQTAGTVMATTPGTGTITVTTPGAFVQNSGTFGGPVLTGTAASVSLPGANTVMALGSFTSTGAFAFNNAGALAIAGPVTAGPGDAMITTSGALTVAGSITAPNVFLGGASIAQSAGTVTATTAGTGAIILSSSGDVTQTGGLFSAAVLTGSVGSLQAQGANVVTMVSGLSGTGRVAFNDTVPLSLNSAQAGTGGTGDLVFVSSAGIMVVGSLSSPGVVALTGSTVTEAMGSTITAGTRFDVSVGAAAANFMLAGTIMSPDFRLGQAEAVAGGDGPKSTTLVVAGPFSVGASTLDLESVGAVTQTGTTVTAGTLTGSGSTFTMTDTSIGTLGAFTTTAGTFSLIDSHALTVSGPVNAVGGDAVITTAGALTLTGNVFGGNVTLSGTSITQTAGAVAATTPGTGTVTLSTTGAVMQSMGASIGGAVLAGTAGSVSLPSGNNILTLSAFTLPGQFLFSDSTALNVAGPLMAGTSGVGNAVINSTGVLTVSASVTAQNVSLTGANIVQMANVTALAVGNGFVSLTTAGTIAQQSGTITAAFLTGSAASTGLTGQNMVGTLASFSSTGPLALMNAQDLTVTGPVSAGAGGLSIATSGALTLAGALSAPTIGLSGASILQTAGAVTATGTLTLASAGAVAQVGGTVMAAMLTGNVGSLSLPSAGNSVPVLGPLNSTGAGQVGLVLDVTGPLTIPGVVQSVGNVVLATTGALTVNGTLGSSAGGIFLAAADPGAITINGTLNAPSTDGLAGAGIVSLSANTLVVSATALLTAGTRVDLAALNGTSLTVNGPNSNLTFIPVPMTISTPTVRLGQAALTTDGVTITDGAKALDIIFRGNLNVGSATLDEESINPPQTNGFKITSGGLSGVGTGDVIFDFGNSGVLGPYYTTGSLTVTSTGKLTVKGYAVAGNGAFVSLSSPLLVTTAGAMIGTGTVSGSVFTPGISSTNAVLLTADTITAGAGTTVSALGGTISVAPLTPRPLVIEAAAVGTELALTPTFVQALQTQTAKLPGTLVLGNSSAMPSIVAATATSITIAASIDLTHSAGILGLYTTGNITGTAGVTVGNSALGFAGTITGGAGGSVNLNAGTLAAPLNSFDVLNNFSAGNGLSVSEIASASAGQNGLTVLGTVSSGTGVLGLLSVGSVQGGSSGPGSSSGQGGTRVGGTITVGQGAATLLDATGQTLSLTARDGAAGAASITEGAGTTIKAATLTGGASTVDGQGSKYDVLLNGSAGNQIGTLGTFIVGTGTGNAVASQGAFRLLDQAPLSITGQVTAKSISIAANSVSVTGTLGACIVGGSGGDLALAASVGSLVVAGGTVGGQSSVGLSAPGGVFVASGLVDSGAGTTDGIIASLSGLTLSGGSVFAGTVNVNGGVVMTGGLLHATALNVGTVIYSDGDIYGGNAVSLSVPVTTLAASDLIGSGTMLTLTAVGNYTTSGVLVSGGTIGLSVGGNFSQLQGALVAASDVTVGATGSVSQAVGGTIDAGGTVLLRGFGTPAAGTVASVLGTVSGQAVQVIEPGYALTVAPAALPGSFPVTVGALVNIYHCPGCDAMTASSTYAVMATPAAVRPGVLRLDGGTLSLGALSADATELHSLGATTQTGALVTSSLTGTAGYAASAAMLPVYAVGAAQVRLAPGDTGYVAPGYTVVPATVGATVTLTNPGNNIQAIGTFQIAGNAATLGGLTLVDQLGTQVNSLGTAVDTTGLVVSGVVRAGPSTDPLDATAEAASGGNIAIQVGGGGLAVSGVLAGNAISLVTSGAITEGKSGAIVASTLVGSGSSVGLGGANQVATLNTFTAVSGNLTFGDSRNLTVGGPVSATNGTLSITSRAGMGTASVKEGAGTGDLTIVAPPVGSPATVTAQNVMLTGTDIAVPTGLIGASSAGDATTGNIGLTATGAAGTISLTSGTIGGQTSVSVAAPGGFSMTGGVIEAPAVTIGSSFLLAGGSVSGNSVTISGPTRQSGGTLHGGTISAGAIDFSGGDLYGGGNMLVLVEPSITGRIVAGGTLGLGGAGDVVSAANIYSGGNLTITAGGVFQQASGTIAGGTAGSGASLTVAATGLVTQAAAGAIEASGAVSLTGSGTGSASLLGQLAGTSIAVSEPNAALTFAPGLFAGATDHPLGNSASVVIGPVSTSFICPGCVTTASGGPLTVTTTATPQLTRPGALALGGGTVQLGTVGYTSVIAADMTTLTSVGATTQVGGSLETAVLSGSAGYAGAAPGAQARAGGTYVVAGTVNGATVTLGSAANNISSIAGYQVRGDDATRAGLTLVDAPTSVGGLVVTGVVRAGPSSDPLDASAAAAGNNVVITVNGANGALTIGTGATTGSVLGGRVVTLAANGGGIAEAGNGRIVAGTLTGSAAGGIALGAGSSGTADGGNQVATLGALTASGGALTFQDSRSLAVAGAVAATGSLVLTAQSGQGTASVAEGQSAGNVAITGSVSGGANTSVTAFGSLTAGTIQAPGTVTLIAGGDVNAGAVSATTLTGTAGGSFSVVGTFANAVSTTAAAGTMTLTDTAAVTLGGVSRSAGVLLVAAPSITSTGQLATPATIQLHATNGGFTQTGGTVAAGTTLIVSGATDSTALAGGITQQAGLLASGGTVRLLSVGDAIQMAAGTVAGTTVQVASLNGANTFSASQAATIVVPAAGVNLSGVLPVFTVPNPAATVTLAGQPGSVRLDGAALSLAKPVQGDTVELHATGNLTEAAGGSIQANVLTGTAGYASSGLDATGLPVYAALNGALPGQGAATLLSAGNNILRLSNFQARSGLVLADAPANQVSSSGAVTATGLVIAGTVRSGLATDPLTAAAAASSGTVLTIVLSGPAANLSIGDAGAPNAVLAGGVVSLGTPGLITEAPGSLLVASTLAGNASSASLTAANGNQVAQLAAFTTAGNFSLVDAPSLTVTGAVLAGRTPPVGTTPVLSLQSGGGIDINGGSLTAGTVLINAAGAFTETNGGIVANSATIAASSVQAGSGANQISMLGGLMSPGGFAFSNAGSLTITGPIVTPNGGISLSAGGDLIAQSDLTAGGAVSLSAGGATTQSGSSTISGTSLTSTSGGIAGFAGAVSVTGPLTVAANGIAVAGRLSGTAIALNGGAVGVTEATGGSITGASLTSLSAGPTALAGTVSTSGPIFITANGISLTGNVGSSGDAIGLNAGTGALSSTGTMTATAITATSGGPTSLAGTVSVLGAASFTANGLAVTGSLMSLGGAVTLNAGGGALAQNGTVSAATTFTGTSGQAITAMGRTTSGSGMTFNAGSDLSLASGSVTTSGAGLTGTVGGTATLAGTETAAGDVSLTAGGIAVSGLLTSTGGQVGLKATNGTLTQTGMLNAAGSLLESASGNATLSGTQTAGSSIGLSAGGDLSLAAGSITTPRTTLNVMAGGIATLAGTEQAPSDVTVTAGGIGVSGTLSSTGGQVGLKATSGALTQAGTVTAAGALTESAAGAATLAGTQTAGGTLGVTANGISISGTTKSTGAAVQLMAGGGALTQTGTVSGPSIMETGAGVTLASGSMTVAGSAFSITSPGAVMLAGSETVTGGSMTVKAGGALSQSGTVSAGTSVIESAGGGAALSGAITAPLLAVTAPSINLNGTTLNVGGTPQPPGILAPALPALAMATSGAFFEAGSSFIANNPVVTAFGASGVSTVRIDLTSGSGTISLMSLNSPSTNLILGLGAGSGTGGNINVRNLDITYTGLGFGGGTLDLSNVEVNGQTGIAAAGAAVVFPAPSRDYRINACAVASVNCVVLTPQTVPVGNPLKELSLSFFRDQDDDRDLLVPNISDQGL